MNVSGLKKIKYWYYGAEEINGKIYYTHPSRLAVHSRAVVKFLSQEWPWVVGFSVAIVGLVSYGL